MRYFGVPTCPYCKKRVNLIRTWSLKRQGEYLCPRCGGASNIHLSPLIYVLALLAVFSSGVLYFFHKYVLDDITLETGIYVFIPFAGFFLFSLFMVYLEKPVIKKVSRAEYEKRRRFRPAGGETPPPARTNPEYFDDKDYTPPAARRPGSAPQQEPGDSGVVNQQAFHRARQQAEIENTQISQRFNVPKQARPAQPAKQPVQRPRPQTPVQSPRPAVRAPQAGARPNNVVQLHPAGYTAQQNRAQSGQSQQRMSFAQQGAAVRSAQAAQQRAGQQLNSQPSAQGRYDDSAYVQRRIQEMERGTNRGAGDRR